MTAPIFISYQNWLLSKSYSDATIRNYLTDLRKYFLFTNQSEDQLTDQIFDQDNLISYFQNINQDQNYKRFLASLSKFFQFALDQQLISENPFPKALKVEPETNLKDTIKIYQKHLEAKKFSISTIRNYINDIHQFINWVKSTLIENPSSSDKSESTSLNREANKSKLISKFLKLSSPVKGRSPQDRGVLIEN